MKIKAIIFDLDRTLLDLKISEKIGLRQLLKLLNINIDFDYFYKVYTQINNFWWTERSIGKANSDEVRQNRFRDTFQHFNIKTDMHFADVNDYYFSIANSHWTLYPDALDQLEQLHDSTFKLAIITNGFTDTQEKKITHLGIGHYFDFVCMSESVNLAKPDKQIFHLTCEELSVNPNQAIYVGDDYQSDIVGSSQAGLTPVWF